MNFEQLIREFFGGEVTADKIISLAIGLIIIVISTIVDSKFKKLVGKLGAKDSEISALKSEVSVLKQSISNLMSLSSAVYLGSKQLDSTTKAEVVRCLQNTEKLLPIEHGVITKALINKFADKKEEDIEEKTEKIIEESKATQETIKQFEETISSIADTLLTREYNEE